MIICLTRAFHIGEWTSFSLISTLKFWGLPLWKEVWSVSLYTTTRSVHPFFKVFGSSSTYHMVLISYYAMTLPRPTGPLHSLSPLLRGQLGWDDPPMHSSSCRELAWEGGNSLYISGIQISRDFAKFRDFWDKICKIWLLILIDLCLKPNSNQIIFKQIIVEK